MGCGWTRSPTCTSKRGLAAKTCPKPTLFLRELRQHMEQSYPGRMLLAEANQWPDEAASYFGNGDECHMSFYFPLMPRLFMGLRTEDRFPIVDILRQTPSIPDACQWALFLRNHDELTLEMVTDEDRDYMYRVYAQDPEARINLGIRRRLAPLLGNHRRRIELMNALLLSLPGTPVIYYGDEIGMGDNIHLADRNGVRTPMQWSSDRNAGFSRANAQRLYLPAIVDPEYHYEALNVEAQQSNPHSHLSWMKRLIALRKRHPAFGKGAIQFLSPDNPRVLAFARSWQEERILAVANLSRFAQVVHLDLRDWSGTIPVELLRISADYRCTVFADPGAPHILLVPAGNNARRHAAFVAGLEQFPDPERQRNLAFASGRPTEGPTGSHPSRLPRRKAVVWRESPGSPKRDNPGCRSDGYARRASGGLRADGRCGLSRLGAGDLRIADNRGQRRPGRACA